MKKQNSWPLFPAVCFFLGSILALIRAIRWPTDNGQTLLIALLFLLAGIRNFQKWRQSKKE